MIVAGVDPGLGGAVALTTEDHMAVVSDMAVVAYGDGFVKRRVDGHGLARALYGAEHVFVERVSAFSGQGVASMFSFGMSYGAVLAVAEALGIRVWLVEPKAWKAYYRIGKDKKESLALARRLYPTLELGLAKDDGKAEALLIARYGLTVLEKAGILSSIVKPLPIQ